MGQRMPTEGQQPQQGGGGGEVEQLITGISDGLVTLAAVFQQQSPELGQAMAQVASQFDGIIQQVMGGGAPQPGGAAQAAGGTPEGGAAGAPQQAAMRG